MGMLLNIDGYYCVVLSDLVQIVFVIEVGGEFVGSICYGDI